MYDFQEERGGETNQFAYKCKKTNEEIRGLSVDRLRPPFVHITC